MSKRAHKYTAADGYEMAGVDIAPRTRDIVVSSIPVVRMIDHGGVNRHLVEQSLKQALHDLTGSRHYLFHWETPR